MTDRQKYVFSTAIAGLALVAVLVLGLAFERELAKGAARDAQIADMALRLDDLQKKADAPPAPPPAAPPVTFVGTPEFMQMQAMISDQQRRLDSFIDRQTARNEQMRERFFGNEELTQSLLADAETMRHVASVLAAEKPAKAEARALLASMARLPVYDIGADLTLQDGKFIMQKVYGGSPAAMAGLHDGDELLAVDATSLTGLPLGDVVRMLRGTDKSAIQIVARTGEGPQQVLNLRRAYTERVEK